MSFPFDSNEGLLIVPAKLWGPNGDTVLRLALDTGATYSLVSYDILMLLGYDPSSIGTRIRITTASGVEYAPQIVIEKIEVLGQERPQFPVLCHTLPATANLDGLLGLDFFRGQRLVLDFGAGTVTVD